jgi:hypothetical protein
MSQKPDPRIEEAINLHLRAIGTDQENITDLDHWLILGGYTQKDIDDSSMEKWNLLRKNFPNKMVNGTQLTRFLTISCHFEKSKSQKHSFDLKMYLKRSCLNHQRYQH